MKVIIAGGRDFNDYEKLEACVKNTLLDRIEWGTDYSTGIGSGIVFSYITILCGMAPGADMLGYGFAKDNNLTIEKHRADWNKYGKAAGPIRNREMAQNAEMLIAFWDGKSKGTRNMIDEALKEGLEIHVFRY